MKKILPLLLALLLVFTACGKENAENSATAPAPAPGVETTVPASSDGDPEGVLDENAPKTVYKLVRQVVLDADGKPLFTRDFFYDSNGFCTQEIETSSNGTVTYQSVNTPDADGLSSVSQISENGSASYVISYQYDESGSVLRQETKLDGSITEVVEYTYDDHGNYLTLKQIYAGELVQDYTFAYTYDAAGRQLTREEILFGDLASRVEMTYDAEGRELSSITKDAKGTVLSRTESAWEGFTETRKHYFAGEKDAYMVSVITYDDNGNVLLEETQYADGSVSMRENTYEPFEVMK